MTRSTVRHKLLVGLAAIALVGGGVALAVTKPWQTPAPSATAQLAASLELAAGEVLLETDGESHRLLSGTPLPEGARLRTAAGARALIRLSDGARVYLDESTTVELHEGLVLVQGRAWLDAPGLERGQAPVSHRVGDATVALSDGGASLEFRDGEVRVYVADGLAIVSNASGRTEAAAGERVTLSANAAPQVEAVAFWDDWTGGMGDGSGLSAGGSAGSGSLYAVDRSAPPGSEALPLQIQRQSVNVVMRDELAETKVEQVFFNPSSRDVEGYYWFTIPEGSQLVSFALETDGHLVEGEVVERKKAARTYEETVRKANDPALLEWIDEHTVRARIFPVPALGSRRIVVRYQQLLTESDGKLRYSYPLAGPGKKKTASIEDFALTVELGELAKDYDVATLAEARIEEGGKKITMRRSGYTPRADFQLELSRRPGTKRPPLRLSMLEPGGDQARYAMVRYSPEVDFDEIPTPQGQVVVVVDTSAAGDPSEYQTRLAVAEAFLRSLSAGDEFAVVSADVRAEVLYPEVGLAKASPDTVSAALERLAEHGTGGATDLGAIFEEALKRLHGLDQPAVVYIGDGMATSGERAGDALAERLRRSMTGSRARLFTVGVGQEVDEALLQSLARIGGGAHLRVQSPEQAIVRALELSGALKTPTITDLEIDLGEGLDDVFINTSGKLSRGQELVVLARTHHDLPKEVTVRGRLGGKAFEKTHKLERTAGVLGQVVPRLWAAAYIERLLGDSRGPEAVRGKVLSLGLEYGLMSPYTSILALESEQAYASAGIERRQRQIGGVRLTANLLDRVPAKRRLGEDASLPERILVGALSAPFGCSMSADEAASAKSVDNSPRSDDSKRKKSPSSAASNDASPSPASVDTPEAASAPEPLGDGSQAGAEPTEIAAKAAPVSSPAVTETSGKDRRFKEDAGDTLSGLAGPGVGGEEGLRDEERNRKKLANKRQRARRRVVSSIKRRLKLPCSDASARRLAHRRILWRKRLESAVTMTQSLEHYEAAAGSCEIRGWKDQRTFLRLLQARGASETDIELLLSHFHDESDAVRYLARTLLRRLVDPSLIASVDSAMFGSLVDWADVDRRVILEVELDDKLEVIRRALARAPGDPAGELRLLELLVAGGRLEEAVGRGRRLREQGLMTPALAQSLGEVMVAHGQTDEAQRLFSEIVEFDPNSAASRKLLGDIFLRHGWYDGAYRQYEDLVALRADDPLAGIRLARAAAGTGRTDEALRTLRKIAAGEGRPGANDPRRYARLHAVAYLAGLLDEAGDSPDIPADSVVRELRRLQLFDGPSTWTLLVWEDLEAKLILTHADPSTATHLGDPLIAGDTGLFALAVPVAGLPELAVRQTGEAMSRAVAYTRITITFDGKAFSVKREEGKLPATRSRLLATPPVPVEPEADEGADEEAVIP
ncbi:MAG: VWA domain-containing protein [Nannocystaceae bacterium]|nr:VWA domain-containing protein [Nannocystaceae bacterium]